MAQILVVLAVMYAVLAGLAVNNKNAGRSLDTFITACQAAATATTATILTIVGHRWVLMTVWFLALAAALRMSLVTARRITQEEVNKGLRDRGELR